MRIKQNPCCGFLMGSNCIYPLPSVMFSNIHYGHKSEVNVNHICKQINNMCVLYLDVKNLEPLRYDVENTVIYRPQTV